MVNTWTRESVEAIAIGSAIDRDMLGKGRWTPAMVAKVFARGEDIYGRLFVNFYTRENESGIGFSCSGSIKEGDGFAYFRPRSADHEKDSDCDVDQETGCCRTCGVGHDGQPCFECGAVAFHVAGCSEMEP